MEDALKLGAITRKDILEEALGAIERVVSECEHFAGFIVYCSLQEALELASQSYYLNI